MDSVLNAIRLERSRNPDKVIKIVEKITNQGNLNAKTKIDAFFLLGKAYHSKRNYKKSLQYTLLGKKIAKQKKFIIQEVEALYMIGNLYYEQDMLDKSLLLVDNLDIIANKYPYRDSIRRIVGNNYTLKGLIYSRFDDKLAIEYYKKALIEYQSDPNNIYMIANQTMPMDNIGFSYLNQKKLDSAIIFFKKSLKIGEKINDNNTLGFTYLGLLQANILSGDYTEAENNFKKNLLLAKKLNDPYLNADLYKWASYYYINDQNKYNNYFKKYIQAKLEMQMFKKDFINESIKNVDEEIDEKIKKAKEDFYCKILITTLVNITIIVYIYIILRNKRKQLKSIQISIDLFSSNK